MKQHHVIIKLRNLYSALSTLALMLFVSLSLSGCKTLSDLIFAGADPTAGTPETMRRWVTEAIWRINKWLLGVALPVGIIFLIITGLLYISALGDKEKLEKAKKALLWTVIGVLVIVMGYIVLIYLFNRILKPGSQITLPGWW